MGTKRVRKARLPQSKKVTGQKSVDRKELIKQATRLAIGIHKEALKELERY